MMSQDAHNLYVQAQQKFDSGNYQEAIDDLNEAIQLVSIEPEYYWLRVRCWSRIGNLKAEMDDLTTILSITDDMTWLAKVHKTRANWYWQHKDLTNAITEGEWLLDRNLGDEDIYQLIAHCKNEVGELEDAIRNFASAIELSSSPVPLVFRAKLYIKTHKYSEAIRDLSEALEKCNDIYDVRDVIYRLRGETYYNSNDKAKALDDFNNYQLIRGIKKYSSADEYMQAFERWAKKSSEYRATRDVQG